MSDEWKDILKIVIGAIVLIMVIGLVFAIVSYATKTYNGKMDDLKVTVASQDIRQWDMYNNTVLTGSDVIAAIRQYAQSKEKEDPFFVNVTTANKGDGTFGVKVTGYTDSDKDGILEVSNQAYDQDPTHTLSDIGPKGTCYISDTAKFNSKIVLDNDTSKVVGITFCQVKTDGTVVDDKYKG